VTQTLDAGSISVLSGATALLPRASVVFLARTRIERTGLAHS